jgi:hypothetical protein
MGGLVMVWLTIIGFKEWQRDRIFEVCQKIGEKDATFKWGTYPPRGPDYDGALVVFSPRQDTAHRRGLLLCRRYLDDLGLLYFVTERDKGG